MMKSRTAHPGLSCKVIDTQWLRVVALQPIDSPCYLMALTPRRRNLAQALTLALLTPAWMRHTMSTAPEYLPIFAKFARNVMEVREEDDVTAAEAGVRQLEAFYSAIRMSANLREAGVKEEDLEVMAEKAVENGKLGFLTSIGKDEALQVMRAAF